MVEFVCSLLGLSFSGLSVPLQTAIIIISGIVILVFLDCIVRFFVSPVFALMTRVSNKK